MIIEEIILFLGQHMNVKIPCEQCDYMANSKSNLYYHISTRNVVNKKLISFKIELNSKICFSSSTL